MPALPDRTDKPATAADRPPTVGHNVPPLAISINDFERLTSIKRTKTYELIASGQLETRNIGRRTLILMRSVTRLLNTGTPEQDA